MLTDYLSLITRQTVQDFLKAHENEDEKAFVLKQKSIFDIPAPVIAQQLAGRKKARTKLPTWFTTANIIYPPSVNLEQCSSEATASFKSKIVSSNLTDKHSAADVTGGLGVDTYYLANVFESVHYIEPNPELVHIARHNHHQLGANNIIYHPVTTEQFIGQTKTDFDLVFIDPSRRNEHARKIYKLADCSPDITAIQQELFKISRFIMVKASPLLDIQQGLRELVQVKKVFIVSVNNECKELLFLAERDYRGEPLIEAVDLLDNGNVRSSFSFTLMQEKQAVANLTSPEEYLFEPNAALLKSGAFKLVAERFGLTKLDTNTHLYTATHRVAGFPGRTFRIEQLDPDGKQLKSLLPEGQVNVICRNYPLSPEAIKTKYRLRDGGQKFLIGFSTSGKKHLALCSRITDI